MNRRFSFFLAFLALGTVCSNAQGLQQLFANAPRNWAIPQAAFEEKALIERGNQKIDPALRALIVDSSTKGANGVTNKAAALGISMNRQMVSVRIAESGNGSVRGLIEDEGGSIVSSADGSVYAQVPLDALDRLGGSDSVDYVGPQAIYYPSGSFDLKMPLSFQAARRGSEGVAASNALLLHQKGIKGKGIKIGILDFGFQGYSRLMQAGRVPVPAAQKAFNQQGAMEVDTVHGAACTEIIHDMAPEAQIYLAAVNGTDGQIIAAAQWLMQQGVDIISFSGGGPFGPNDGRDTLSRFVDSVVKEHNVLWVNAAGNEASSHWTGTAAKWDRNGLIEIAPNGANAIFVQAMSTQLDVLIKWDDWGTDPSRPAATEDIDAFLYLRDPSGQFQLVDKSANPQQGRGAPVEGFSAKVAQGAVFAIVLKATHVTRPVRVHVFGRSAMRLAPLVAAMSISNPATSREALSVAAVHVGTGQLEPFSSQGPTDDNRVKPDIAAPDNNSSDAYSSEGGKFPGTSAACPHVSGFAALIKQMQPSLTGAQLKTQMVKFVRPMGSASPNAQFGYGFIDASKIPQSAGGGGRVNDSGNEPPATLSIALPPGWGGTVSAGKLDIIREGGDSEGGGVSPKIVTGKPTYRIGDGMKMGYKVDRDCYYLLLHRSAEGHYTLIAPQSGDEQKLRAGEKYSRPTGDQTIRVTEPTGEEQLMLICSEEPINLNDWQRGDSGRFAVGTIRYQVAR